MSWSLSEVEGLSRKAASGAGLPWGIAEEAGKAVRWLSAAGFDGASALADVLTLNDGAAYDTLCPVELKAAWQAPDGALCPLIAGAALCDRAQEIAGGESVVMHHVRQPVLLAPYVVMAADTSKTRLRLSWNGAMLSRGPEGTFVDGPLDASEVAELRIERAEDTRGQRISRAYRAAVTDAAAETLGRFARRTYAPDTEASRLAGAGAGLSDND